VSNTHALPASITTTGAAIGNHAFSSFLSWTFGSKTDAGSILTAQLPVKNTHEIEAYWLLE
jgi:hypothetical protein